MIIGIVGRTPQVVKEVALKMDIPYAGTDWEKALADCQPDIVWVNATEENQPAQISYLWGNPQGDEPFGVLVKLPTGFTGQLNVEGAVFHAVIVQGNLTYLMPGQSDPELLDAGSYFTSTGKSVYSLSSATESIIYVRTNGKLDVGK